MKTKIPIWTIIIILTLVLGCIGPGIETEETILDVEEGIGIIGTLKMERLNPGLDGYVSLDVRSNLGGAGATNVYVSLDNVRPFSILECGIVQNDPSAIRSTVPGCRGFLDLDENLAFRQRGTVRLFPGEELEVFWRLRAPSKDEISDITLRHPLYYSLEYDYHVNFREGVVFMSQTEVLRRRQAGEDHIIRGSSGSTAGELRFSSTTQQPIVFAFDFEPHSGTTETNFSFVLNHFVENKGKGFPVSDVAVLLEYPSGIQPHSAIDTFRGVEVYRLYGWDIWNGWDGTKENNDLCNTGIGDETRDCSEWIEDMIGRDEFRRIDESSLMVKIIDREHFTESFTVNTPMILPGDVKTRLRDGNIPLRIYSFRVTVAYRYFLEGKEYITVFPLRGI